MDNTDYAGDIVVPESVTYNGRTYTVTGVEDFCTFKYARALRSVVLPATIKSLPSYAFSWCSALGKVVLGDNLVSISDMCFLYCGALREVSIPASVESIGERAFEGCTALSTMTIPASVKEIDESAFVGCKGLSEIYFSDSSSLLRIGYGYYGGTYKGAFDDCPLVSIYMGRNIKNLYQSHESVFSGHKTLREITLGNEVSKIYESLFSNCTSLTSVTVQGPNLKEIQNEAFRGCSKLQNFKGDALKSVEIIGNFSFSDCPMLKEIVLPQIKSIGRSAFYSYDGNLEKVLLGDKITTIPERCFYSQSSLKYLYLGSAIRNIDSYALGECKSLQYIFLFSDELVRIGNYAIPSTVAKIYVTEPSRYANILNDFNLDHLAVINPLTSEYSGIIPGFSCLNNVLDTKIEIEESDVNINVGEYNVLVSVKFTSGVWSSTTTLNASYTITPAPLTVIANDASRKYGMENPKLACSFFGFKNGETCPVLTRMPNVETTATISSNAGTYPIIPSGAEAKNYTFNYERGTLTITKADQTIEWEQQFGAVNVGDVVELTATSSAGLPIKYTSTDETVAEIFTQEGKKFVEFSKPGSVSLHATQEGNENYNEADRVSKSVKVDLLVSSIILNQNAATIAVGNSLQLTATVEPINASNKTLIWESANTEIATVDDYGKVNALKPGSTIITVRSTDGSNISDQCELTVVKLVDGISINITTATLIEGQSLQLEAIVSPESATNKSVEWSSSNEAVAAVSEDGKVTAISKGSAVITAKSTDGSNVSASCHVNVIKLVSGIVLSDIEITLNEGQSTTLTAIVTPELANNKNLTWESSNTAVATVTEDGKVTAISKGLAVITAKSTDGSNISASCTVNVVKLVSGIVLSETEMTLNEGSTAQLTAIVSADANNPMITWMSSNESVATVSQDGKVSAIAKGTAIITAKATDGSNISASCTVNVVKLVNGIILSETDITLNEGETVTITATVTPDLANNKAIVWTSSNESIATVDEYGVITAHLQGKAIITAKSTDGSNISASCAVTVIKLVTSIYINNTMVGMKIGEQTTLTAYAIPSDATNTHLRWYSEDEGVATVEDGVVTAVGIGTTYICVESTDGSNIVEKCEIEVGGSSGIVSITTEAISVYVVNGIINIANVPSNQTVRIFHSNGTMIKSELSTGNLMTFQPSANGIYIVVVGTSSDKVVIR